MRKVILKISVGLLAFLVGLTVFYLLTLKTKSKKSEIYENFTNELVNINNQNLVADIDPWQLPENFPPLKKGEFFNIGHGCGNGYIDGWLAYDSSHLSEGFNLISQKDFQKEISNGKRIIEKINNYPNKDGKKGLRIVLEGENQETGKKYVSILWFGKWDGKRLGRYFLDGPNLEIALELEKWLINENSKK